nr:MAG TPA: hypothetical protein [Caudoviricetes sp.]
MIYKQYKEKMFDVETRAEYDAFCAMVNQDNTLTTDEQFFLTWAAWQNYIEYNQD